MEEYKICFDTYEISNFGNCRRLLKKGEYKQVEGSILSTGGGYKYFQTNRNGKRTNYLFHHLVAEQFIGSRPEGLVIDHIDRNALNNRVENLRYVTQQENSRNHHRVVEDIPFDENRKYEIGKKYREDNKEELKIKKKTYYENNKEQISQKEKDKGNISIACSICKTSRNVSYSQYNNQKRKGLENSICRKCSSINNLVIANEKKIKL